MKAVVFALTLIAIPAIAEDARTAVFAGGCFWCMEPPFDAIEGVLATTSGFSGGHLANPSYEAVTRGGTGHLEVVQVTYDPAKVSYQDLLGVYWHNVDPFDAGGQFCDRGASYRAAIFVANDDERAAAEASKDKRAKRLGQPIVTSILPAAPFYPAEEYHQNYYAKNPLRYKFYRYNCGRDRRLAAVWGD